MTTLYKYKVYCNTEQAIVYTDFMDHTPTTCPNNNTHTIDTDLTVIVDNISTNTFTIQEESHPTGGNFCTTTVEVNAPINDTGTTKYWFDTDSSALNVKFIAKDNKGDILNMYMGDNIPVIGVITADVEPCSPWSSANYVAGDVVTFNHPDFGSRVYTCILNTTSNQSPTNSIYWIHGYEVNVSPTVVQNVKLGYFITLTDGINTDNVGRIISIDSLAFQQLQHI